MASLHATLSLPTVPVHPLVGIRPNHKRYSGETQDDRPRVYDMATPLHTWPSYTPFCPCQQFWCIHLSSYIQLSVVGSRRYVPTAVGNSFPKRFLKHMFVTTLRASTVGIFFGGRRRHTSGLRCPISVVLPVFLSEPDSCARTPPPPARPHR